MAAKNYAAFTFLLPSLIQFAENIHGPKKGGKKLAAVKTLSEDALKVAAAAGVVDPDVATYSVNLTDAIERELRRMKEDGRLEEEGKFKRPRSSKN